MDDTAKGASQYNGKDYDDEVKLFPIPVDSEHKAKVLRLWSFSYPHHPCFQLNW